MNPRERLQAPGIDISKPVSFFFDGRPLGGYAGDTLASALLANGVRIVGRSFKLHRPRGLFAAGAEEPHALLQLEDGGHAEPNVRATLQPLYPGLRARGQNAWPSVRFDLFALLGLFKPLLPASFYYKTMKWPGWKWYEWAVRRLAGLGRAPRERDAQHYQRHNAHCDLLIVGAGPAGLAAALQAAPSGLRILLLDEGEEAGGSLLGERELIDGEAARRWLGSTLATLRSFGNVEIHLRTTVSGYYDHDVLSAIERVTSHLGPGAHPDLPRERWWRIRARRVLLATGATERPLVFPNNDRPGVMLAGAVRRYLNHYGVAAGTRAVVATTGDDAYRTAIDLSERGIAVAAVVDVRGGGAGELGERVRALGIEVLQGCAVVDAHGRRGLRAVSVVPLTGQGTRTRIRCDLLAVSGGWSPLVHLFSQSGGSLRWDEGLHAFLPDHSAQSVDCAGALAGALQTADALASGAAVARVALQALGAPIGELAPARSETRASNAPTAWWVARGLPTTHQWVDLQYDVTAADIELAARENFVSVEHMKRHTTAGMSLDQGKTSNVNALAILAGATARTIPEVGTTRFRPPYHPVTMGAIAGPAIGEFYAPRLELPAHDAHVALGARFDDYGGWQRPACYPRAGEHEESAVRREVRGARAGLGLFDASPLGKIEVRGPDAAEFLNRVYVNNMLSLAPGCARYGLMLNEQGIVIDDGVLVRLADEHFIVHSTSSGSTRVFQMLEEWLQCEWTTLRVCCVNVTTAWATITLSGGGANGLLQRLDSDIDFAPPAFAHMRFRAGHLLGLPVRVLRASFSGEASYEISVAADHGHALWRRLLEEGAAQGITPYGIESLMVLRTEKGYLHVGADTDGTTNPLDLGWGPAIAKKSADFIGRRSLSLPNAVRADRLCFTGIEPLDPAEPLPIGAHVLDQRTDGTRCSGGYVTSSCFSPTLGRHIGLGIVRAARERQGEIVGVMGEGRRVEARLRTPVYFDPEGARLNG